MDPVYILHLDTGRREGDAPLFRGGALLLQRFDKRTAEADTGSAHVTTGSAHVTTVAELATTLDRFAARAWAYPDCGHCGRNVP